ncbi:FtsX-like permease family protein, partial [Actinomadura kijaniata]|uniref:FtsX-like permease family protein n=1 Tax=Actinomadura kijaniata TaxID=46161 RepID=UPI000A912016
VEALGEASGAVTRVPWARVAGGVVALAVGAVLTGVLASVRTDAAAGPLTPLTALAWTTAVTLLGPVLARVVLGPPALALAPLPGTGGLASLNLRAGARRLAPVVAPLTLMIALSSTLLFAETTLTGAGERQAREGTLATHVIGPGVPGRAAEAVRRVPGVRAATEVLHTRVRAINSPYGVQGVTAEGLDATMDLGVTSGSLAELGNGTMAAREGIGMKVGDRVSFSMADGTPVTLRVVAVYRRGLGFGDLTLPHALVAAHVDAPLSTVLVAAPGVSRDALAAAAGAPVRDRAAAVERRDGGAVNRLALGLIVAFAAITMVNTLAMAVAGRSRELALLRLVGATRRQVLRMVRLETLVVVLVAAVLGTLVALVTLVAYSSGMTGTATPHVPVLGYLGIVGGAGLLALLAAALPARAALRSAPVEGLGVRE